MVNSPEARCSAIRSPNRRSSSRPVRRVHELGLEAGLPFALREQALLRREAEGALVPSRVGEHAELAKQLAGERGSRTRHGDVVRGPRIARDRVLAAARVAARLALELEQNEVAKAATIELPRRAQSGDAATDDHDGHAHRATRCGHRYAVAQPMPDAALSLTHPPVMREPLFLPSPRSAGAPMSFAATAMPAATTAAPPATRKLRREEARSEGVGRLGSDVSGVTPTHAADLVRRDEVGQITPWRLVPPSRNPDHP